MNIDYRGLDISQITANWNERGFSCDLWTDPPNQRWENFSHSVDELLMVIEGKLELEINQKVTYPQVGEEILIPANAVHSVRNIGTTTARWLYGYKREN